MVEVRKLRIYFAARASIPERSELARRLRDQGWDIVSTWIDEAGEGETECFKELWQRIEREIQSCDGLVLYAEKDDFPLKGALVEVGMALAMKKSVFVVLPGPDFLEGRAYRPVGSWLEHPSVAIVKSLDELNSLVTVKYHFDD